LKKLSRYLVLSLVGLSSHSFAFSVSQLQSLIDAGKYQEAYQLATENIAEHEGDPSFDFHYGVAAIDSGQVSEGVFALERVIFLQPQNQLAQLELARGYYLLQQYGKARALFTQVKQTAPPVRVATRIDQYLALIEAKTSLSATQFRAFVELLTGYDDNINSGPSNQTSVVTLTDAALGRGDAFYQFRAGASVDHAYSTEGALNFAINTDFRSYDTEPAQDYSNITLSGGHTWTLDEQQYLVNFVMQKYSLDDQNYRDLLGASLGWNKQFSRRSVLKTFVGVNQLSYDDVVWKDARQISTGANYLYGGSGNWNPIFFAGFFVGQEEPDTPGILADATVDRVFYGGNAGVQLSPTKDLTLTPSITYQASDYQGEDWIYNIKREDRFAAFNLNMALAIDQSWSLIANYTYTHVDSNIELYEYDRQQVMLGLRYNFQ